MAQLLVRRLDDAVVAKLRERAAARGVSVEEEHRRILHSVLLPDRRAGATLKEHLERMPDIGDDELFARSSSQPRPVDLE